MTLYSVYVHCGILLSSELFLLFSFSATLIMITEYFHKKYVYITVIKCPSLYCCYITVIKHPSLYCRSSLQVLFDFRCVCSIESFQFLVKLSISLIDIVNIGIFIVSSPSAVFRTFLNPKIWGKKYDILVNMNDEIYAYGGIKTSENRVTGNNDHL